MLRGLKGLADMILGLVSFILVMLLVVGVHEAGHALVARVFNVKIEQIVIGFGRPLLRWTSKSKIQWIWALWPLGGAVRLLNTRIAKVPETQYPQCFDKQSAGKKTLILLAGAMANLMLCWLALLLVFSIGIELKPAIIEDVMPGSIAAEAGIKANDQITSVHGTPVESWQQFGRALIMGMGSDALNLFVKTPDGQQRAISLNLKNWRIKPRDRSILTAIGIVPDLKVKPKKIISDSFFDAAARASTSFLELFIFLSVTLKLVLTGVLPFSQLLGPAGMLEQILSSFSQGLSIFSLFVAGFSMAVAIVNLLPVPGLDGASIVYAWLEKIRGKPISVAMEILLYQLAVIFFIILLFNLFMNDLQRYLMK